MPAYVMFCNGSSPCGVERTMGRRSSREKGRHNPFLLPFCLLFSTSFLSHRRDHHNASAKVPAAPRLFSRGDTWRVQRPTTADCKWHHPCLCIRNIYAADGRQRVHCPLHQLGRLFRWVCSTYGDRTDGDLFSP